MKTVKKCFWSMFAAVVSILAWVTNAFQLIRNIFLLVIDLPGKALTATTVFIGVVYGIACFFIGNGFWGIVGNIAGGCLVLFLAYKIFNFVFSLGYALVGGALSFFDFEGVTNFFAGLLQKAIYRYMDLFGPNEPTKKDRMLFAVPWLVHKINWLFEKLSSVISIAAYAIFGGAGVYFGYQWIFASYDISDYGAVDYIVSWAAIVAITCIAIYIGHCVAQAIRMATESVKPLDELFGVYAEFFRNTEGGDSNSHTASNDTSSSRKNYEQDQSDCRAQYAAYEDNPYYQFLSAAQSAEELQKLYRGLAKKLHPDVCKEYSVEEATKRMAQLNNAYEALKKRF